MLRVPRSFLTWSAMSLFSQKRDGYRFIFAACSLDVIRESASGRGLGKGSPRVFCCRASDCYRVGTCHTASAKAARSCRVGSGSGGSGVFSQSVAFSKKTSATTKSLTIQFGDRCDVFGVPPSRRRGVCAGCCRAFGCYRVGTCVARPLWLLSPQGSSGRLLDTCC